jgi:hypothetical protein
MVQKSKCICMQLGQCREEKKQDSKGAGMIPTLASSFKRKGHLARLAPDCVKFIALRVLYRCA